MIGTKAGCCAVFICSSNLICCEACCLNFVISQWWDVFKFSLYDFLRITGYHSLRIRVCRSFFLVPMVWHVKVCNFLVCVYIYFYLIVRGVWQCHKHVMKLFFSKPSLCFYLKFFCPWLQIKIKWQLSSTWRECCLHNRNDSQ